jgi:hypothetical protein
MPDLELKRWCEEICGALQPTLLNRSMQQKEQECSQQAGSQQKKTAVPRSKKGCISSCSMFLVAVVEFYCILDTIISLVGDGHHPEHQHSSHALQFKFKPPVAA